MTPMTDLPAAVLWDMDGTLVDTEPYWIEAEFGLAEKYGGSWSREHAMNLVGHDLLDSGRYIREHMGIDLEPSVIVEELLDRVIDHVELEVPWRPGAVELLADLNRAGIPCALVTMSYRRFVAPILASLPDDAFATIVTGDAVSQGKPHPEPYLKAARNLGVAPGDCLAIEDSNTGARSAVAAGCTVLVVPNHVPVLPGERRVFRDSLADVTAHDLAALD
jgi:HAD superfamily hydrolase (TIGR01509 family)